MEYINDQQVNLQQAEAWHSDFRSARPYPYIVIDNFLKPEVAEAMYDNFPKVDELRKHYKNLNEKKSEGSSFDQYHPDFNHVRQELGSQAFLTFMEKLTGIEGLILPDDHRGSGLHQGTDGSYLDVHVDFSVHPILNLHRRLNLLIFLNKNWKPEYGGALELWDPKVKNLEAEIMPGFNKAVIFECSDVSYHGYDKISIPEGETRKSMFVYLYTPVGPHVKYHDTIFKARPSEGLAKRAITDIKETGKNGVKKVLKTLGMKKLFEKYE